MLITPISHPLNSTVHVPGSKSLTNRALLIAALADGKTRLTNALFSDDSRYFAKALQTLGFDLTLNEAEHEMRSSSTVEMRSSSTVEMRSSSTVEMRSSNTVEMRSSSTVEMQITGLGGRIPAKKAELFIGNAGTAARFLSAFLTLGTGEYILDGEPRMRERPIGDLVDSLTELGAQVTPLITHHSSLVTPPLKIIASGLPGGKTTIAGDISSQFLSALLMVAPYAQNPIEITLSTDLNSKPYVDMTIAIMRDFGVEVWRNGYESFKVPLTKYAIRNTQYAIESDASAASYFFAAPAICGGSVRVENISRRSVQGDIVFLDVLARMGCVITESNDSILVTCHSSLKGLDVDMRDIPDTAQTLAAIAPFADSPTRIRGIASARVKETDRVAATCTELARLGVKVEEHPDGMTIYPLVEQVGRVHRDTVETHIQPATIKTYNDHRMAMAFSLIGLRVPGVTIENPGCVSKTFPNFFEVLETLRQPITH